MTEIMLTGEVDASLDSKNRLTIPAKLRPKFEEGLVVSKGFESCLNIYSAADWEAMRDEQLRPLSPFSNEARSLRRFLYSGAMHASFDKQGRIGLSPRLMEYAHIAKDVVLVGVGDSLEVWDQKTWNNYYPTMEGNAHAIAQGIAHSGV